MRSLLAFIWMAALCALAHASTTVLDPGPGTDYLSVSCGGQTVNEIATGFDTAANAATLVKVSTTCHGSGRGSPNQYYLACWTVTFAWDGSIASQVWLATNHWQQGNPSIPCPVSADPGAVYTHTDGAGNFPVTLSTSLVGTGSSTYRAVLETACAPIALGDVVAGVIGAPGAQLCYFLNGSAGNGVGLSVARTSGDLLPAVQLWRPDGTALCSSSSGSLDCTLDTSGRYVIVVRDANGSGTGGYEMSLTRTDVPRLTIGMTATVSPNRRGSALAYRITVGNAGGAAAPSVVVDDTLPSGVSVGSLSASQGSCSRTRRSVTCSLGTLDPGSSAVVDVGAKTGLSSGQITNTACVAPNVCATTITDLP